MGASIELRGEGSTLFSGEGPEVERYLKLTVEGLKARPVDWLRPQKRGPLVFTAGEER